MTEPAKVSDPVWRRRGILLAAVIGIIGVCAGAAVGAASVDTHDSALKAAQGRAASLSGQLVTANATISDTRSQLVTEQNRARHALVTATAKVKAQDASVRSKLAARQTALSQRTHQLVALHRKVTGEVHSYNANTIPGDGEFLVGKEISPGIYHADASAGCYWARLASLDTSNINDNDNVDGPVTVQISSSDVAFQTQGCSDFHKIG